MDSYFALIFLITLFLIISVIFKNRTNNSKWKKPVKPFPASWEKILFENVSFYNSLDENEKEQFELKIHEFLTNIKITGVETEVFELDRVLIAASAIIPIFAFPNWQYFNLTEVLLYPGLFNTEFSTYSDERSIAGMVGTGFMEGKMILSKQALHHGFKNESDKKNTAIHEFAHLIDKADGNIDGIPSLLLEKQYTIPWLDLIRKEIDEIYQGSSDINPYGATNKTEFFAVISEYFFERPKLLKQKHPELYELLEKLFDQKIAKKLKNKLSKEINRNDPCPCGSGKKYKKCCGKL